VVGWVEAGDGIDQGGYEERRVRRSALQRRRRVGTLNGNGSAEGIVR
jgi:hypothetical protein